MAGSGSGQEVYEMILERPVPADGKEAIRDFLGSCPKLSGASLKRLHRPQSFYDDINCHGLKTHPMCLNQSS